MWVTMGVRLTPITFKNSLYKVFKVTLKLTFQIFILETMPQKKRERQSDLALVAQAQRERRHAKLLELRATKSDAGDIFSELGNFQQPASTLYARRTPIPGIDLSDTIDFSEIFRKLQEEDQQKLQAEEGRRQEEEEIRKSLEEEENRQRLEEQREADQRRELQAEQGRQRQLQSAMEEQNRARQAEEERTTREEEEEAQRRQQEQESQRKQQEEEAQRRQQESQATPKKRVKQRAN